MTLDQNDDEWYSPMEALKILESHLPVGAKALVADKLRDGLIRARADKAWRSKDETLGLAIENEEKAVAKYNIEVPKKLWNATRNAGFDLEQAKWPTNRFVITRSMEPPDRTILLGVKFRKQDIDNLLPETKNRGGPPPNYASWAEIFNTLLVLERENSLKKSNFSSMADFQRVVIDRIHKNNIENIRHLSEDVMRKCLVFVWDSQPD